jgi:hypothetical protein
VRANQSDLCVFSFLALQVAPFVSSDVAVTLKVCAPAVGRAFGEFRAETKARPSEKSSAMVLSPLSALFYLDGRERIHVARNADSAGWCSPGRPDHADL